MKLRQSIWQNAIQSLPLMAILRGIQANEAISLATVLFDAGFEMLEIPLNSPDAYQSIENIVQAFPDKMVGAGTVTSVQAVNQCLAVGAKIIVAPNLNNEVAKAVQQSPAIFCPGVCTPSEAFSAIAMGADLLKLFPAEMISPAAVKAMRAVLPPETLLAPVGGISATNMAEYLNAGANGFGIGSALYKPGKSMQDIGQDARKFISAYKSISL